MRIRFNVGELADKLTEMLLSKSDTVELNIPDLESSFETVEASVHSIDDSGEIEESYGEIECDVAAEF